MKKQFASSAVKLFSAWFLAALFLLSTATVVAQNQKMGKGHGSPTPEERAKRQTEKMKESLSLTSAQEPKVSAINLKYAKKMEDVRKVSDTAAQRKSTQALNKQKDTELKTVLTAEQFKLYLKQVEELKAKRRNQQKH
jgi:Spy/CpxP family protein refolding chaperone